MLKINENWTIAMEKPLAVIKTEIEHWTHYTAKHNKKHHLKPIIIALHDTIVPLIHENVFFFFYRELDKSSVCMCALNSFEYFWHSDSNIRFFSLYSEATNSLSIMSFSLEFMDLLCIAIFISFVFVIKTSIFWYSYLYTCCVFICTAIYFLFYRVIVPPPLLSVHWCSMLFCWITSAKHL